MHKNVECRMSDNEATYYIKCVSVCINAVYSDDWEDPSESGGEKKYTGKKNMMNDDGGVGGGGDCWSQ